MATETFPGEFDVCDDCQMVVESKGMHVCAKRLAKLFPDLETARSSELKQSISTLILLESMCERVHVTVQPPGKPGSPYVRDELVKESDLRFLIQMPNDRWGIGSTCMCASCRPETALARIPIFHSHVRLIWLATRIKNIDAATTWFDSPVEALTYVKNSVGAVHFFTESQRVLNEVVAKRKLALETMRKNA